MDNKHLWHKRKMAAIGCHFYYSIKEKILYRATPTARFSRITVTRT